MGVCLTCIKIPKYTLKAVRIESKEIFEYRKRLEDKNLSDEEIENSILVYKRLLNSPDDRQIIMSDSDFNIFLDFTEQQKNKSLRGE